MRGVLSSEDLKVKHEYQDLAYRLIKMRDELGRFLTPFPEYQKQITKALDTNSALVGRVQGLNAETADILRTAIGNLEQLVRLIHNSLEFYPQTERESGLRNARVLDKIIVKFRNQEEMIYKRGIGRSVA